jgi:hypothetical protein
MEVSYYFQSIIEVKNMFAKVSLLPLMITIGLIAGCVAGTATPRGTESSPAPTVPQTDTSTVQPSPRPTEQRPPAVEEQATPMPAQMARADLARRLNTDTALIEIVDVSTRAPDPAEMPCLADGTVPERVWRGLEEVTWVTLSVKSNRHHYLAWGEMAIYCEEQKMSNK